MTFHLSNLSGLAVVLVVLIVPSVLLAHFLHSGIYLVVTPLGIIALALILAALPIKRKVTPQQFADELKRHLSDNEGPWDWDDTTSIAIADERLERLRGVLFKFDRLETQEQRDELASIIVALRRGDVPEVTFPTKREMRRRGFIFLRL